MEQTYGNVGGHWTGTAGYYDLRDRTVKKYTGTSLTARTLFSKTKRLIRKKDLIQAICDANGRPYNHGYMNSTIAHHTNTGRLARFRDGRKTFFKITAKGMQYIQDRKIFE